MSNADMVTSLIPSKSTSFFKGFFLLPKLKEYQEKRVAIQRLIEESHADLDYFILLILATIIITIGLVQDNTSIVIGGMLIAPLLSSVLAFGLSFVTYNLMSIVRSFWTIFRSLLIAMFVSFVVAKFIEIPDPYNSEIVSRLNPTWVYVHFALVSGFAATYSWAKPKLSETLPGVAVAVALLPPVCVMGIALGIEDQLMLKGAFSTFIVNFSGIVIAAILTFTILRFDRLKTVEALKVQEEAASA
ncbi:TIGR00341 family protein [candidate division WWE3 bacterium]|uniref:TIGR00341 family protein n=1 Tax=candidate division WWE3 bacterium TaxID=2053526 RepID=A0A955EBQ4_UNCKA|nr:TIGR00341 family protein [candidate division WWE3 bacterium]